MADQLWIHWPGGAPDVRATRAGLEALREQERYEAWWNAVEGRRSLVTFGAGPQLAALGRDGVEAVRARYGTDALMQWPGGMRPAVQQLLEATVGLRWGGARFDPAPTDACRRADGSCNGSCELPGYESWEPTCDHCGDAAGVRFGEVWLCRECDVGEEVWRSRPITADELRARLARSDDG